MLDRFLRLPAWGRWLVGVPAVLLVAVGLQEPCLETQDLVPYRVVLRGHLGDDHGEALVRLALQ
jgi:hypothetical protein